jgi:hypothetical protein
MPLLNVGRIINSPNFSQTFTVYRESGSWKAGRWVSSETQLTMFGTITAAGALDLNQVSEGDRVTGVMCFYSQQEIFVTHASEQGISDGTSDQIEWNGDRYRISSVTPWSDFGYYKAIGVRMVGE